MRGIGGKALSLGKHLFNVKAEFCSTRKQKKTEDLLEGKRKKMSTYWNQIERQMIKFETIKLTKKRLKGGNHNQIYYLFIIFLL